MSFSDIGDIIEATPQKKFKKSKKSKQESLKKHQFCDYLINPLKEFIPENKIRSPICSTIYNNPYVFYSLEETKKLPQDNVLNAYIHTLGVLNFSTECGHFLTNFPVKGDTVLNLNFNYVINVPKEGKIVSVYGGLDNKILLVKFFRVEEETLVEKYLQKLVFMRNLVPTKYLMDL